MRSSGKFRLPTIVSVCVTVLLHRVSPSSHPVLSPNHNSLHPSYAKPGCCIVNAYSLISFSPVYFQRLYSYNWDLKYNIASSLCLMCTSLFYLVRPLVTQSEHFFILNLPMKVIQDHRFLSRLTIPPTVFETLDICNMR